MARRIHRQPIRAQYPIHINQRLPVLSPTILHIKHIQLWLARNILIRAQHLANSQIPWVEVIWVIAPSEDDRDEVGCRGVVQEDVVEDR